MGGGRCWNTEEQCGEAREVFAEMVTRNKVEVWSPGRGLWGGQGTLKRGDFKSTGVGGNYELVYVLEWKAGARSGGDQTRRSEQGTDC